MEFRLPSKKHCLELVTPKALYVNTTGQTTMSAALTNPADDSSAIVPSLVRAVAILLFIAIPVRIVRFGFRPVAEDTLADAAKAITGHSWTDFA